jgi:hypothetical protein
MDLMFKFKRISLPVETTHSHVDEYLDVVYSEMTRITEGFTPDIPLLRFLKDVVEATNSFEGDMQISSSSGVTKKNREILNQYFLYVLANVPNGQFVQDIMGLLTMLEPLHFSSLREDESLFAVLLLLNLRNRMFNVYQKSDWLGEIKMLTFFPQLMSSGYVLKTLDDAKRATMLVTSIATVKIYAAESSPLEQKLDFFIDQLVQEKLIPFIIQSKETIPSLMIELESDYLWDKFLGIKTESVHTMDVNFSKLPRNAIPYEPTSYDVLGKIITNYPFRETSVICDLGCGIGRAVLMFSLYSGASKVMGVELLPELVTKAKSNVQESWQPKSEVELVTSNAATVKVIDDVTEFFMFNPFNLTLFEEVMSNIRNSLERNPRQIRVIYYTAAEAKYLDNQTWLKRLSLGIDDHVEVWESASVMS